MYKVKKKTNITNNKYVATLSIRIQNKGIIFALSMSKPKKVHILPSLKL